MPDSPDNTATSRDAEFFRREEQRLYAELEADVQSKMAWPAPQIEPEGALAQAILDDLLRHPLCQELTRKPKLYIHCDPTRQSATFGNVIILPLAQISVWKSEPSQLAHRLKAVLAHELGHLICRDADPANQARDPDGRFRKVKEKRADLVASHLCGDGGEALLEWARTRADEDRQLSPLLSLDASWQQRCASRSTLYPSWDHRIDYLREWSTRFQRGHPLPEINRSQDAATLTKLSRDVSTPAQMR